MLVARVTFLNPSALADGGTLSQLFRWKEVLLAAALLVMTRAVKPLKKLHPIVFIVFSALIGILLAF